MQPDGYVKIKDRCEGRHHLGRREHQLARGRGRALPASGRARRGGRRAARSEVGRDAVRVRRAEARRGGRPRTSSSRIAATHARALQGAEDASIFGELPKTSTGKIQKFLLRERAQVGAARSNERGGCTMNASRSTAAVAADPVLRARSSDGVATLTLNRPRAVQRDLDARCSTRCRPRSTRSPRDAAVARRRASPARAARSAPGTT